MPREERDSIDSRKRLATVSATLLPVPAELQGLFPTAGRWPGAAERSYRIAKAIANERLDASGLVKEVAQANGKGWMENVFRTRYVSTTHDKLMGSLALAEQVGNRTRSRGRYRLFGQSDTRTRELAELVHASGLSTQAVLDDHHGRNIRGAAIYFSLFTLKDLHIKKDISGAETVREVRKLIADMDQRYVAAWTANHPHEVPDGISPNTLERRLLLAGYVLPRRPKRQVAVKEKEFSRRDRPQTLDDLIHEALPFIEGTVVGEPELRIAETDEAKLILRPFSQEILAREHALDTYEETNPAASSHQEQIAQKRSRIRKLRALYISLAGHFTEKYLGATEAEKVQQQLIAATVSQGSNGEIGSLEEEQAWVQGAALFLRMHEAELATRPGGPQAVAIGLANKIADRLSGRDSIKTGGTQTWTEFASALDEGQVPASVELFVESSGGSLVSPDQPGYLNAPRDAIQLPGSVAQQGDTDSTEGEIVEE